MRVRGASALLLLLLAVSWGRAAEAEDAALSLAEGDEDAALDDVFDSALKGGQEDDEDAALFEADAAAAADADARTPLESMVREKRQIHVHVENPFRRGGGGGRPGGGGGHRGGRGRGNGRRRGG